MTTVIGDAFVRVRPITNTFTSETEGGLTKLKSMLGSLGVPASLMTGFALTGTAIAGAGVAAVSLAVKMQSADAAIAASSGVSMAAAKSLGDAFLSTGGKSEYSGQQMATAYAAVAGQLKATQGAALTNAQAMTFMYAATDLAKASGQDLGTTTQTLGGVLQAFQLKVKDAANVSNVLFNASNATGQSFTALATSLERVRSRLGNTSPPLAALTALMVDMTKNGITGRTALSGLNTAMTALMGAAVGSTKVNKLAKQTLADYGIAAQTADGQLVSMATVIDKLAPKYATMTQAQQLSTSATIFGNAAAKGMTAVIDGGTRSYNAATDAVTKHNSVQDAAALKDKTLSVEIEILKVAIQDMATRLGEVLLPAITKVAGAILPLINDVISLAGWFEKGSPLAIALGVAIGLSLTPALVGMGIEAVAAFGAMMTSMGETIALEAMYAADTITAAATVVASWWSTAAGIEAADTAIVDANEVAGASFLALLGPIGLVATAIAGVAAVADKLLHTGPGTKVGNFLTKGGSWNPINDIAGLAADVIPGARVKPTTNPYDARNQAIINAAKRAGAPRPSFPGDPTAAATSKKHDAYIAPPSTTTKKKTGSAGSTKMDPAELALQAAGTAALNVEVTAAHSKSLAELNKQLDAAHTKATASLITRLDATHNTKLEAMATKITTDYHNMEVAKNAILTSDSKTANAALNTQISLVNSTSLASLNTGLNAAHTRALTTLEAQLNATHNKNLQSLATQLVAVHKQAMENLAAQTLAAQAAAALKLAGGQAAAIGAQETVNEDQANMAGLTGDAYTVAAAQLALDQRKLTDAQQAAALQAVLDATTTAAAKANAQAALDNWNAQATVQEASLAAALSWDTNMQTINGNAASAAAALATAAPAIVAAVAPIVAASNPNTIGGTLPVPVSPITSVTTVTITAPTSSTASEIAAQVQTAISQNNENLVNLMAARGQ
jgi:TP901 family phage tail tape measure protein